MPLDSPGHEYSFIPRSELPQINEAISRGDIWKRLWHWLALPDPTLAPSSRTDDWWARSPFRPSETTPSFHMNAKGWYCFSTGRNGSFLNLAAELLGKNIYHAAHDIREALLSGNLPPPEVERTRQEIRQRTEETVFLPHNPPIRADLTKSRYFSAADPRFDRRGIPLAVFEELGAGFLDRPARKDNRPDSLNHRNVFQVRGISTETGELRPVILTHIGRAGTDSQHPKWWIYPGFQTRCELYNLDLALLDPLAREQARASGHVLVVEGAYDVANLYGAGIRNVVATFGKQLHPEQIPSFELLSRTLGIDRFLIFYDRGQDGRTRTPRGSIEDGAIRAAGMLTAAGLNAVLFHWDRTFSNSVRQQVPIPPRITDPCEFSAEELRWLRHKGVI